MVDEEIGARLSLKDRRQFTDDAEKASKSVKNIGDEADKVDKKSRNMAGGLGVAQKGVSGLARVAKWGGVAIAAGFALGSVKAIQLGMDAAETQSKFDTVFKGMTGATARWVDQMNSDFGIPRKELQDAAATFGVFGKAAGVPSKNLEKFSTDLTGAGMDLASFYNVDQNDVFLALKSGLAGEAEPLRAFGIFLSDAAMKAEALSMGLGKGSVNAQDLETAQLKLRIATAKHSAAVKKYGANSVNAASAQLTLQSATKGLMKVTSGGTVELTEAQKVMVRQSLIMKSLGDAQGDLKRTSGGLANQWRGLKGRLTEAGTAIGTAVLPYVNDLVGGLNDRVQPAVKWLQKSLPGVIQGIGDKAGAGKQLVQDWIGAFKTDGFTGFVGAMDNTIGAGGRLRWALDTTWSALKRLWTILRDSVLPTTKDLGIAAAGISAGGLFALNQILGFMADHTTIVRVGLVGLIGAWALWKAGVIAHNIVMAISGGLMAARIGITMLLTGATGLNAGAEMTRNQAMVASIALHARLGAMMIWSLARTVASTTGNLAMAAAMGVVRAAVMAWTAAQWLLNVAMSMNPIGLVVLGIVALVAIFIVAWKHSETFRNIVTGAFHAVLGAASSVWNWIKGNWPLLLAILTGPIGVAIFAIVKNFDRIKGAVKGAINWIIRAWNGLQFKVPGFDPPGPGPKFSGFTLGLPKIPELHSGGTTTSGGLVNMKPGEEIVVLPPAATVVPDHDNVSSLAAAVAGRSGGPTVLQLVVDRKVLAEAVYEHTGDKVARQ